MKPQQFCDDYCTNDIKVECDCCYIRPIMTDMDDEITRLKAENEELKLANREYFTELEDETRKFGLLRLENSELRKQKQADDYLYQQAKTQCETAFRRLENVNEKHEFLIGKVSEIVANSITPLPIIIQNKDVEPTDEGGAG